MLPGRTLRHHDGPDKHVHAPVAGDAVVGIEGDALIGLAEANTAIGEVIEAPIGHLKAEVEVQYLILCPIDPRVEVPE